MRKVKIKHKKGLAGEEEWELSHMNYKWDKNPASLSYLVQVCS